MAKKNKKNEKATKSKSEVKREEEMKRAKKAEAERARRAAKKAEPKEASIFTNEPVALLLNSVEYSSQPVTRKIEVEQHEVKVPAEMREQFENMLKESYGENVLA